MMKKIKEKKALAFAFSEYSGKKLKCKRSQHETLGFVVIVALVVIVGVIFLAIKMNTSSTVQQPGDSNLINFLTASSKYTSDCFENHEPETLNDLKYKCYNGDEKCDRGGVYASSCEVLNQTYSEMLATSWLIYDDSPVKYYELKIYYRSTCNDSNSVTVPLTSGGFIIRAGNLSQCSGSSIRTGQDTPIPVSYSEGSCIMSELKICEKEVK